MIAKKRYSLKMLSILMMVIGLLASTNQIKAQEGTKQLMPNSNDRLWLEFKVFDGNNFGLYGCTEKERINIHMAAGEKMFFGMKMNTTQYSNDVLTNTARVRFRVKSPSGTVVYSETIINSLTVASGLISTYTQAITGPNGAIINGTTITTGYNPMSITAAETGDYYIEFTETSSTYDRFALEFFDVTVTDATNHIKTNPGSPNNSAGRLWSRGWTFTTTSYTRYPVNSYFYVFTSDEFINKVNFRMYPYSFTFVVNSYGVKTFTEQNYIKRAQSQDGDQTTGVDISEYRVFLNDPDRVVWPNTKLAPPKVQVWTEDTLFMDYNYIRNPLYLPLDINQVVVEKNKPGCSFEDITFFKIETNIDGFTAILIDVDKDGVYSTDGSDRVIYRNMKKGINYVLWDFKNDAGAEVAVGNYNASATYLGRGPAHFPLYDVEQMDGITTSSIRPFNKLHTTIYWDDTQISNWGDPNGLMDETQQKQLVVENDVPRTWSWRSSLANSEHNGNMNTMNTWFNALDLGYSNVGIQVQQSATKCVDGLAPWVGDVYKEGPKNNDLHFTASDFTYKFFDPREYSLSSIQVKTLPTQGALKLSGTNITINQIIPVADIPNITYTPVTNWYGKENFEWKGYNGEKWSNNQEKVYLIINTPPVISDIPDQTLCTNVPTGNISFTIGDDEDVNSVTLIGFSADPSFVPNTGIVLGGTGTSRTVSITPVANKSGKAIIYVMADDGLSQTIEEFTVYVGPDLEFSGDTTVCVGDQLYLIANETGATSYSWKYNGTTISTTQSVQQAAGSVSVGAWSLTVVKNGCTSTRNFTVSVSPLTSFSGDQNLCVGETLSLSATEVNASYIWRQGTTIVSTSKIFTIKNVALGDAATDYTLYVDKDGCTNTSSQFAISVVSLPNTGLTITGSTVDPDKNGTITISNAQSGVTYNVYKNSALIASEGGSGSSLVITIPSTNLELGDNPFIIKADNGNCEIQFDNSVIIHVNTPSYTVTPTSGLVTTEAGGTATFTIRLNTEPSSNVTINLISSDLTEGTVSPASVVFTPTNYNTNQTIIVTGVNDNIIDGNIGYTIVTTQSTSDSRYNAIDPSDVSVTNNDNDVAGVTVNPTSGLTTTEAGGTATFTLVLTCQPTSNVTINLTSSDLTEGTVSPASVTFTSANWNTAQTVTVTGVNDNVDDDNQTYSITTSATSSTDTNFSGLTVSDVSVTNTDDDVAGITVTPNSGLITTEAGGTATFTIVLTSQPTANVTIGLTSSNTAEGTVSPSSVTFTSANWNTAQTVTITGVNDNIDDDNVAYTIVTAQATSTDGKFSIINPSDVSVTNNDNDAAGITVTPITGLTTTEAGGTATFTIVLTSQPTADVTIGLSSSNTAEGTVSPASLTFTTSNWNTAQTVTVTGVNDNIDDDNVAYTIITAQATGADGKYNVINPSDVSVTNNDDDVAGITVTPTSGLVTTEAGGTATFTVRLNTQPTTSVALSITSSNTAEGTVSQSLLSFTTSNWNTAQTITLTGIDDYVVDGNINYTVTVAVNSGDSKYSLLSNITVSATNNDNDAAGVTVTPTSIGTTEAGGTGSFTLVLTSQPSANVTISFTGVNSAEGSINKTSVTFTSANWSVAQSVTVTGVDDAIADGNVSYTIVTTATSSYGLYNGISVADVTVTNADNDIAGITVSPTSLTTTEGGSNTFTIALNTQPTADVTINITSSDLTEGTVNPSSVTFTSSNWSAKTITITGVNDDIDDGDITYSIVTSTASSSDVNYGGVNPSDVTVTNIDDDVAGITVTPISGLTTTEAGGTASFTVVLTSQPTANVTIGLTSSNTAEGTVSPSSLTFTAANWSTAQTVTVTGVNDNIDDDNVSYNIVTAQATSTDGKYNVINPSDVSVTNTDNDIAGITVTPTGGLTTTEAGGTATFTVVLTSQPTANVTIGLTSSNTAEGTVSPSSLTFTAANWSIAQTVTITGVNDNIDDDNVSYTIVTAQATSTDGKYNVINPSDVSVTNTDNDAAGITVTPTSGLTTTEAGGTATFTVVLTSQPTANVTIGLTSSNTAEGTVSPSSLTFTAANWSTAQTVTITGVNDNIDDDNISYIIVTAQATSTDSKYSVINPSDVSVTNTDNDAAGITVTPTSGLTTTEAGGTATFTVVLTSQPTANVTIGLTSSNTAEGTVSPSSLTFTAANWNTAQTVTVTGVNDNIDDDNVSYTIVTAQATSTDGKYSVINPSDVSVTNTDDDVAGVTVTPTSGLTTTEAGGTATFTVKLNTQPTANVTIGLTSSNTSEGTVSPSSLTFTAANWSTAQTVTINGVNDFIDDGDITYSIVTGAVSSTDSKYNGLNASDVSVTNVDNDDFGIIVTPTAGLYTRESGTTATFTIRLNSQPTTNVTIGLTSSNTAEGTVSPSSLTFTTANWSTAQTVTVTGVNDNIDDGDVAYTIITNPASSTDPLYNNLDALNVSITNQDDDAAGITVNPVTLTLNEEGSAKTFTVVLNSEPTQNVTIGISSNNTGKGTVSPASITFTALNWNIPQVITVTPVDNYIDDGDITFTIVTDLASSLDDNYKNRNASDVSVTSIDNDVANVIVSATSGSTNETGTTSTFTIKLNSQPTDNVTIGISSDDTSEGTVLPASVTFTTINWGTPQTITITGVDDAVADGNQTYHILLGAAVSLDDNYNGIDPSDITMVNSDDDSPGITVYSFSNLITAEDGTTATFTMNLNSQPTNDVTINLSSTDITEGTIDKSSLTFTSVNWNIKQIVTITGVDDLVNDGDIPYTIITANSVSADPDYNNIDVQDVTVTNKDDIGPRAVDDVATTNEDTQVNVSVLANDKGLDKGSLGLSISQQPSHGTVVIETDNTITYKPNGLFNGDDTFIYKVCDGNGGCDEALVTVTVTWMDDQPVAVNDARGTSKNTPVNVDVLFNDYGLEDGDIVVSVDEAPAQGTAVANPDNTIKYTPASNFIGTITFKYKVTDVDGDFSVAQVTINVREVNSVPVAVNDNATTSKNTSVEISVLANDSGLNDGFGRLSAYTNPSHGTVVINAARTITYTPSTDYIGNDSFQYLIEDVDGDYSIATVTITVTDAIDHTPIANADRRATNYQTAVIVDVLTNDTGLEDGVQSVTISSLPVNGNAVVNADFTVTYTPNNGFSGVETFGYQVSDNDNDRSTATVTITVLPEGVTNHIPVAVNDNATTIVNTAVGIDVLANDSGLEDGFGLLRVFTNPAHGTALVNANRTITYTPSNLFVGSDSFQYWVEDVHGDKAIATVSITVTEKQNHLPVANDDSRGTSFNTPVIVDVLINDSGLEDGGILVSLSNNPDPLKGNAVVNLDNTITFTPATDYIGLVTFQYKVEDKDGDNSTATVTINVKSGTNYVPFAVDDIASTTENKPVTINVLSNDSGLEDGIKGLIIYKLPQHGTVVVNTNYTVTYTPSSWYVGADSFDYMVSDLDGDYGIATVSITVNPKSNSIPFANNDSRGTSKNADVKVDVLFNDTGLDDGILSLTISSNPVNGSVEVNPDHTVTYSPNTDYIGTDNFVYQVCDVDNECSSATVTINVKEINYVPDAIDDKFFTKVNTSKVLSVLSNDLGLDDGGIKVELLNQTIAGTAVVNPDNTISYIPLTGFEGSESFQYIVTDVDGDYDIATITVVVTSGPIPGFNITPLTANTDESGTNALLSVSLTRAPASNVVINFTSGDLTEGTVGSSSLTFTSSNWSTAQTLTVTGVDDNIIDGSVSYDVTAHINDATTDDDFDSIDDQKVSITNADNDVVGFTLSKTTATTTEKGVNDSFTVVLTAQPNSDVVLDVTSTDLTEGTVDPASLTFTSVNWNTPQTITITSINDNLNDGTVIYNVIVSVNDGSSDDNFDTVEDQIVVVTNSDNSIPVAVDDTNNISEEEVEVSGNILVNDTDADGDALVVTEINSSTSISSILGSYGSLICNTAGEYTYTLDSNNGSVKSLNNGETLIDTFSYTISDGSGGFSSAYLIITIGGYTDLEDIRVPKGFSPDGNNINDTFIIKGIENYPDNELSVYNRWGNLVYHKKSYNNDWDGSAIGKNKKLPIGTYFYVLKIEGKSSPFKGYVYIKY